MDTATADPDAQPEPADQEPALTIDHVNRLLFRYDHSPDFGVQQFHASLLEILALSAPAADGEKVKAESRNAALEEVAVLARSTHFTRGRYEARFGVDGGPLADAVRALRTSPEPADRGERERHPVSQPVGRLTAVKQGDGYVVLGTDQIVDARTALPPEVIAWSSSHPGFYVKRQGIWSLRVGDNIPRDARPGVHFVGVRLAATQTESESRPEGATE